MKKFTGFLFILFMFSALLGQTYVKDQVNVKMKPAASVTEIEQMIIEMGLQKLSKIEQTGITVFRIGDGRELFETINKIREYDFVEYAEPQYVYQTLQTMQAGASQQNSASGTDSVHQVEPFFRITKIEYVPGEVLVKYKNLRMERDDVPISQRAGIQAIEAIPELRVQRYRIVADKSIEQVMAELREDPMVAYAEPNYIWYALEIPNDPDFNRLWGLNNEGQTGGSFDADIDAPEAWETNKGNKKVIISIIDTGVDYTHPDLAANMWKNTNEIPNNQIDDDNNGFVDDYLGWDFVYDDPDPIDDHNHGTHCAGTVGAVGNNGEGIAGVNWTCSIMPLKFLNSEGSGTTSDAIQAIIYATDNGANILSNSWGGDGTSEALKDAITYARDKGVLFIAAAGNESNNNDLNPNYPSNYNVENVIAVAASDDRDRLAGFSNYGATTVDLAAPGVYIYSTVRGVRYETMSGTSMATPHVAGAAALVWSNYYGNANMEMVKYRLFGSVNFISSLENEMLLDGRLNVNQALSENTLISVVEKPMDTENETGPYPVKAAAVDVDSVSVVRMFYRISGESESGDSLIMSPVSNYVYGAEIPGAANGSQIEYKIYARDGLGNMTESRFYSFRIGKAGNGCCGSFAATVETPDPVTSRAASFMLNFLIFFGPPLLYKWKLLKRNKT